MFVPNNMEERLRHVHVNGKKESVHNMMDQMEIAFPNLGIDLKYVPKGFTIFGDFTIAIYGICIAVAVICGVPDGSEGGKEDRTESGYLF